ncbi:MAG: LytTR family DNA-binding domain-containing protein [Bacteroidota bacterium]
MVESLLINAVYLFTMFKTIIVEDNEEHVLGIQKIVTNNCSQLELVGVANDIDSAYDLIVDKKPNLVLLDIVLQNKTAFELLDKLIPIDFEIIFITTYDKYSLKAIKYAALDYLIKPVNPHELELAAKKAIKKIIAKHANNQLDILMSNVKSVPYNVNQKIAVPTLEGYAFIEIMDIVRCEAHGACTYIFLTDKSTIIASKNIKEYEDQLPKRFFFRIHNSHLVNINRMQRYTKGRGGSVTMEDGTQIEVASRRRADFLKMFQ